MASQVISIIQNSELFIAFEALSSQPKVVIVTYIPELFIAFRAMGS